MNYDNKEPYEPDDPGDAFITDQTWELVFPVLLGAVLYTVLFFFVISFLADKLNIYVQVIIFFVYMFYSIKTVHKNFKEIIIGDRRDTLSLTVKIKDISLQLVSIALFALMLLLINKTYQYN